MVEFIICIKIELESKLDYENLLQEGTIQLGFYNYKKEQIATKPSMLSQF
jgi:hypothetical protein